MIPFVAAGGLLIALSFLFGGYEIVGPVRRDRRQQHALQPARPQRARPRPRAVRQRLLRLHRRASSSSSARRRSSSSSRRWPATSPTRSPTGRASRPGFVMGGLAIDRRRRFDGVASRRAASSARIIGGVLAGIVAQWIARWKVPLGPRPDAGPGHPAVSTRDRRPRDDRRPRQADRLADGPAQRRPEEHERAAERHPARRRPRPDDGLRHGRPAQQGRLHASPSPVSGLRPRPATTPPS